MNWVALATYRQGSTLKPALVFNKTMYDLGAVKAAGVAGIKAEWLEGGILSMLQTWSETEAWLKV